MGCRRALRVGATALSARGLAGATALSALGVAGAVALSALGQVGAAGAAEPALCLSWPGEPVPLPQVNDADPARARWAALRAGELAREAALAEATASVAAQRLWRRVLCLDPERAGAREGLARTRSVQVHRPELRWGEPGEAGVADPWLALSAPVRVSRTPPSPPPEPPAVAEGRARLEEAETSLAGARFSEALGRALAARDALAGASGGAAARALRVRTEVVAATAQVALGDDAGARESFVRALAVDPALTLDPQATSPKVLEALAAARAGEEPR